MLASGSCFMRNKRQIALIVSVEDEKAIDVRGDKDDDYQLMMNGRLHPSVDSMDCSLILTIGKKPCNIDSSSPYVTSSVDEATRVDDQILGRAIQLNELALNLMNATSPSSKNEAGGCIVFPRLLSLADETMLIEASECLWQALHVVRRPPGATCSRSNSFATATTMRDAFIRRVSENSLDNEYDTTINTASLPDATDPVSSPSPTTVVNENLTSALASPLDDLLSPSLLPTTNVPTTSPQLEPEYDEGMRNFQAPLSISAAPISNDELVALLLFNLGQVHLLLLRHGRKSDRAYNCFLEAKNILMEQQQQQQQQQLRTPGLAIAILHNLAHLQYCRREMPSALQTFESALPLARTFHETAVTLNCIGVVHLHCSSEPDTAAALECFYRSLALLDTPRLTATVLNNIGRVQYVAGNLEHSLNAYKDAIVVRRQCLGNSHLDVAATVFNAGQTLHHQGKDLPEALQYYHEFLRIAVQHLGPYHRDVAYVLKCMAQIYHQLGDTRMAIHYYQHSLTSTKHAYGPSHPEVASVLNKLGNLYYDKGDLELALQMYQTGLVVEQSIFDSHHPNVAVTLSNIAQIHKLRDDHKAALALYEQVYAIQLCHRERNRKACSSKSQTSNNDDDIAIAVTVSNMALLQYQSRNYAEALELYQDALRTRRECLGEDHLDVASTLNSIGLVLFKLSILPMALESFDRSLRIRRELLGDHHRDVAVNLYNMATIFLELGDDDAALQYYKETLRVETISLGKYHADLVQTLTFVAHVYQQRGQAHEAIGYYRQIFAIQQRNCHSPSTTLAESTRGMAATLKSMANLHLMLGETKECITALVRAAHVDPEECRRTVWYEALSFQLYVVAKLHPPAAAVA